MPDAQPAAHLGSSSKPKGRSTLQGGAKKRALPLKSPRSSSAGPKLKAAPVPKSSNKVPREASPHAKAVGKPAAKPPPKAITPLREPAAANLHQQVVTAKPPPAAAREAKSAPAVKGKAPPSPAEREQQAPYIHLRCVLWIGASSPQRKPFWRRPQRCVGLTPVLRRATIVTSAPTAMSPQTAVHVAPNPTAPSC